MANQGPAWTLAKVLIEVFREEGSSVSAEQPTRESSLPYFGSVAGAPKAGKSALLLYCIDTVVEKPTPTDAEQRLIVPSLRAGHYLYFFGLHVFTPTLMQILKEGFDSGNPPAILSDALQILAGREALLATILPGTRFDLGARYGILQAQLVLALKGRDREEILALILELLAR